MTEIVRLLTVFMCFANIGAVAALFGRVGRYIIPKATVRALMLGNVCVVLTIGAANFSHIHKPITWAGYLILLGVTLKLGAIVSLWHWYGTPEGHEHTERMVGSVGTARAGRDDLEPRFRRLALGVLGLYGIALATILVIGYWGFVTHDSLCTFRADLDRRADGNRGLLHDPASRGKTVIDVYGVHIPRSVLQNQLRGQERTLMSLDGLRC